MPNWCNNTIEIKGDKESIDEFKKFLDESDGKDWFNFFLPTPVELKTAIKYMISDDPNTKYDNNGDLIDMSPTKSFYITIDSLQVMNQKVISVKDIPQWGLSDSTECRRIDAKNLGIKEKKDVIQYIIKHFRNGMLVLEDINTYILNVTHMEEIVGGLVNLRHRAVDMLISYQSLRAVEPRMYGNARWMRMHYQADNVDDIKGKINNLPMYKIAQIIVNTRYFSGDKRFYLYIYNFANKIEGKFTKKELG